MAQKGVLGGLRLVKMGSQWAQPTGMYDAGVRNNGIFPADPDPAANAGKSIDWLDYESFLDPTTGKRISRKEAYEQELLAFGDGLYVDQKTKKALDLFSKSDVFKKRFTFTTRWGVRPTITNILAGGIDDSYHATGEAVDIQHNFGTNLSGEATKDLQDVIIQALASGFRGIGFGPTQFHFDTRPGRGGFLGYVYQNWPKKITPMFVMQSILRDRIADVELSEDEIKRIARDTPLTDSDSGRSGKSKAQMSEADIEKYIKPLYGKETEVVRVNTVGRDVAVISVVLGVLFAGIYGAQRFFRSRAKKKETERLLQDRKRRVIISKFRNENKRAIAKAKKDPELAAQLEDQLKSQFALYDVPFEEQ
jgi:hypothetical protein